MLAKIMHRPARSLMIAVSLAGVSACSDPLDSSETPSEKLDVALAYMQLTVQPGQPAVAIVANGQGAQFTVEPGTASVNISAHWLNAARQVVPDRATTDLAFSVSGATFAQRGSRDGVISGLTPGVHGVRISVSRIADGQSVFVVDLKIVVLVACSPSQCPWDY